MAQLNYQVLKESGYDGFVLEQAPEKVMSSWWRPAKSLRREHRPGR